jgi:hypothetical protein
MANEDNLGDPLNVGQERLVEDAGHARLPAACCTIWLVGCGLF